MKVTRHKMDDFINDTISKTAHIEEAARAHFGVEVDLKWKDTSGDPLTAKELRFLRDLHWVWMEQYKQDEFLENLLKKLKRLHAEVGKE